MISKLRSRRVLKRISELIAIGMDESDIKDAIQEEFKINASVDTIKRLVKSFSIRKTEIMHKDQEFAEIYKSAILELVNKIKENLGLIDETRQILKAKMDLYKETANEEDTLTYIKELLNSIKVQNDTIKTMNGILQRLESETKETTMSAVKAAQFSINELKELENAGMIEIKRDYYLVNEEKEDKNETKISENQANRDTDSTEKDSN